MQMTHANLEERFDELEALLSIAEGLAAQVNFNKLAGTATRIHDTLIEIRRARQHSPDD